MKSFKSLIILLFLTKAILMTGQDLSKHQWENRLLVMLVEDTENNADFEKQIGIFRSSEKELKERKLLTYLITPKSYYLGPQYDEMHPAKGPYKKYKQSKMPFEMILIGLDGGIKERWTNAVQADEIFKIIDVMPMRRAEIKRKNKE